MDRTQPEPDTKDWTWVLERPCPECGFVAASVGVPDLPALIADSTPRWLAALGAPGATSRPAPGVWSVLEYGCHLRDVHRIFAARLAAMLDEDGPSFANWDQDATAVEKDYAGQDPATVAAELAEAADAVTRAYALVTPEQYDRAGYRSNGSVFTVLTLGRYHLHDVVHHAHDIGWGGDPGAARVTRAAYDAHAADYARASADLPDSARSDVTEFAARVGAGARVLEIGSGGGRDAAAMEALGLRVRRTDVVPGFVEVLRAAGHEAEVLDPLTDDLSAADGPYDAVWANASLLHVARADLPEVLRRLAEVTRSGGVLRLAVKQGDGEGWSTHGSVPVPRRFTYWQPDALGAALEGAGWRVESSRSEVGGARGETWLEVAAVRA